MKCKLLNSKGNLCCTLQTEKSFRFSSAVPCGYEADTVAYAAVRLIRHCPAVRDRLTAEAVRMGLSTGKARRRCFRVRADARKMELPGVTAVIRVGVAPGTVTVRSVKLF